MHWEMSSVYGCGHAFSCCPFLQRDLYVFFPISWPTLFFLVYWTLVLFSFRVFVLVNRYGVSLVCQIKRKESKVAALLLCDHWGFIAKIGVFRSFAPWIIGESRFASSPITVELIDCCFRFFMECVSWEEKRRVKSGEANVVGCLVIRLLVWLLILLGYGC